MKKTWILVLVAFMISLGMSLNYVSAQTFISDTLIAPAQKTQSFVEAGGLIAYIDLTRIDERTTYDIDFSPPDGVSKLISTEIIVKGDFPPSSIITISLNSQPCSPRDWRTPESDNKFLANYEAVFECVDNSKERIGTKWIVEFSTNAVASNVRLMYKNKYINDWNLPEVIKDTLGGTLTMHGTEYTVGDRAKVWLQAIDSSGHSVNTAACYVDIYYPYGSQLVERATMTLLEDGVYYYDILVPDIVGIYPAIGLCYYSVSTQEETADAGYILNGTQGSGSYTTTATKNNAYWNIDEALTNGTQRIAVGLNYTSVASLTGLAEVDFEFQGRWNGGTDVITIYFYNWTSGLWQALPNTIPDTGSADLDVSNSIVSTNVTISGIRNNGNVYLQFRDSTGADVTESRLRIDYMAVNLLNISGDKATEIKGSSELHVKAGLLSSSDFLDVETVCGPVDPLLPDSCGTLVNFDDIMNYLEKEIEVNITVTSLASENDTATSWVYQTPITQDCTSIYHIYHYNGTGWVDIINTAAMYSTKSDENCHIEIPITANVNQVDYYRIIMDNYMLWEIQWTQAMANLSRSLLTPQCLLYGIQYNYTFEVPITENTTINYSNSQLYSCHKFLDDLYYIDYYSNLSNQVTTVSELTNYYVEVTWYQSSLKHHLQLVDFILDNANYYISVSMPASVWGYSNRTLTDLNQTLLLIYLGQMNSTSTLIKNDTAAIKNDTNVIYSFLQSMNTGLQNSISGVRKFSDEMVYLITDAFNSALGTRKVATDGIQTTQVAYVAPPTQQIDNVPAEVHSEDEQLASANVWLGAIIVAIVGVIVFAMFVFIKSRRKVNGQVFDNSTNTRLCTSNTGKHSIGGYTNAVGRQAQLPNSKEPQRNTVLGWSDASHNNGDNPGKLRIRQRLSELF